MKIRDLLVAAMVLSVLIGALYWSNHHQSAESSADSNPESSPKILTLQAADIAALSIRKKSGDSVALARNDAGQWQITAPQALAADQDAVSNMLSTLTSLNSDRLVEDKASNFDQYGLTLPSIEVEITKKDGKPKSSWSGMTHRQAMARTRHWAEILACLPWRATRRTPSSRVRMICETNAC